MREIPRKRRPRGRFPKMVRADQHDQDEDKGLRTMLEEIRGRSKSQRRRSAEKSPVPHETRRVSENHEPRRSRTHVVSQPPNQLYRAALGSSGESNRHVSGRSTSKDSYSGKKEAMFELYEDDYVEPPTIQKNLTRQERLGNPSPGEGLRNALGNLENRLHRKHSNRTELNHNKRVNECQQSSSEKGFATLVEELVEPQRSQKGVSLRSALLIKQRMRNLPANTEVRLTFSKDSSLFCPISINVNSPSPVNDKNDTYLHYLVGRSTSPVHTLQYYHLDNRSPLTSQNIPPL